MGYFICAVLVTLLICGIYSEKCSTKNFNVTWYRTQFDSPTYEKIFDLVDNGEVRIIKAVPHQNINVICANTIRDMENLYTLNLNSIGIKEIRDGSFRNVPNLFDLDLSENELTHINDGVFNGLKISFLRLNANKIKTIDSAAFNDMDKLKIIDLSKNKIEDVKNEWFKNTNNIIHLILDNNNIKSLNANAFKHLSRKENVSDEDKWLSIHLSRNQIKFIHPRAFDGLKELNSVYLHENKIGTFHEDTFSTLNKIKKIDVMFNEIECLSESFEFLLKADDILLHGNPWNCSCLNSLKRWSEEHNVNINVGIESIKCLIKDMQNW